MTALRITLQIELVGRPQVDVFLPAQCGRIIGTVNDRHRPGKIPVVRIAAKFDGPLRRAQHKWIVRSAPVRSHADLIVNVEVREVDRPGLCERQIELELTKPHVQGVGRQMEEPAQVVVLQVAVAESAGRSRATRGKVVVNPERQVVPEASGGNHRERVRDEEIRAWNKRIRPIGLDSRRGWFGIPVEESGIAERDWNRTRNLAGVNGLGKRFLLRFSPKHNGVLFYESLVILSELESVLFEDLAKIIQLRIVTVAGGTRGAVFPGKRGDRFSRGGSDQQSESSDCKRHKIGQ